MSLLRRFLVESKNQWGWLALLILALITAAIFEVSAPVLLGKVVDAIVSGLQTDQDINTIFDYKQIKISILSLPLLIQSSSGLLPSIVGMPYSPTLGNT